MSERKIHWIVEPVDGIAGQTSEWRTAKPVINYELCTRCEQCWLYCPDECIEIDDERYPHIDDAYCKGCMICAHVCPAHAISEEVEDEQIIVEAES